AFGTPVTDGFLQVREGDTITATYQDVSPAHTATATAQILASGPTIHDVAVVDTSAMSATIVWATTEPATTEARYGPNVASPTRNENTSHLVSSQATTPSNFAPRA